MRAVLKYCNLNFVLKLIMLIKRDGFTLFELLVSISIIGILVALAVVSFSGAQKKARDTKRIQDMKAIQTAAEQYYSQVGTSLYTYPASTAPADWTVNGQALIQAFPIDPKSGSYSCSGLGVGSTGYCCCANMEQISLGNSSNASCTFGIGMTGPYFCVKNQQ